MKGTKWMVLLCAAIFASSMTVGAAPFDAAYYAAHNPDVVAAVGTDPMALYMHFVTTGVNEGRFGNATFNAAAYKAANPDLADTLGGDLATYANHYMTVGQAEGRSTGISSGSNGSGSNGSGNSSQSENPYARFQNSGSTSSKHSKSRSSEKTEESSSDSENNSRSFTDYTVNGITGPDSLAIGVKGTYDIDYTVNSAAIPEGFELYASIDDLLINNQSIIDNKGQSTDDRVEIEWEDSGELSFTVKEDIGGSITVYAVFNVRQEGCTGRDDPNNINLALVEPTKTVTITSGTATQASNLSSNIMVTSIGNVQDEPDQESSTVATASPADAISASEEDDKELDEKIEEDSEEETEEELETETGEETEEESESESETDSEE